MKVQVHMNGQSLPIKRDNVVNAYTKDGVYCLLMENGDVKKYPLCNIFEITEKAKEVELTLDEIKKVLASIVKEFRCELEDEATLSAISSRIKVELNIIPSKIYFNKHHSVIAEFDQFSFYFRANDNIGKPFIISRETKE